MKISIWTFLLVACVTTVLAEVKEGEEKEVVFQ